MSLRLKQLADIAVSNVDKKSAGGEEQVQLCNYTDVYYNDNITSELSFMKATATAEQASRFALRRGDVLITKDSETADDIAVAAYVAEDMPGVVCGYHLAVIRPRRGTDGRYLFWALRSSPAREQFAAAATGVTRFGLRYEAISDITLPMPNSIRQRAIADYLDTETARIDALIAKKRRMIDLICERRRVLISSAVKGPFGTDAEAVEVVPLKRLFSTVTGGAWGAEPDDGEVVLPCVRGTDFDYPHLRTDVRRAPLRGFSRSETAIRAARRGDLLVEKSGGGETQPVGRVVLHDADDVVMPTNFAGRLRPARDVDPRFACYLMASLYSDGTTRAAVKQTTGIQNLDIDALLSCLVGRPTFGDQCIIADHLDTETARIDMLTDKIDRQRKLLAERRRALITAAVTGELFIPGVAA